jgi:hypothetical protein
MRSGEYTFSASHDTGAPPPDVSHPRRGLTRSPDVFRQLARTWNELRSAYHDRVRDTFVVAIRDLLAVSNPTTRAAPPSQATPYGDAAMDRILAEPAPLPAAVDELALPDVPRAAGVTDGPRHASWRGIRHSWLMDDVHHGGAASPLVRVSYVVSLYLP